MHSRAQQYGLVALAAAFLASSSAAADHQFTEQERAHWAFQPVVRPKVPALAPSGWMQQPIDAFVLAELKSKGIEPSPAADRATLLRRASLDLLGLLPTPEEVRQFVADESPNAWEKVVNRLLASPQYGERWARHWLDLARFAESEGFKNDETRPNAWRYRDYVIKAFNDDKPYDRFVQEQIAGDEMWPADNNARIATAFNRHYPDESNARNLMQRRQEILNDITDTVGAVFTGLTYGCARCHDHKYDAILQTDYFRLQAFFANTAAKDDEVMMTGAAWRQYQEKLALWEGMTRDIRDGIETLLAPGRKDLEKDYFEKYPDTIRAILNKPADKRSPFERQMAWKAAQYLDPKSREYVGNTEAVVAKLKADKKRTNDFAAYLELKRELDSLADFHPGPLPAMTTMGDIGPEPPPTFLLNRGAYDKPKQEVSPGFLQILNPAPARIQPLPNSSGRRTALAGLLTDPANPLTARVMVNRIWHYHFGRGIVATPSDFGVKGERPTHPELLDWLASEFAQNGWSMKKLHRLILTSATYQQSSLHRPEAAKIDPDNKLLWRYPRHRLEGEVIRDAALQVAGLLNPKMFGPSVFPELPEGMPTPRGGWKPSFDSAERNRRSVYVFVRRNTRYPMFDAFDMPDPHESCSRRNITTSPIQALTMLNSHLTLDWARSFAGRILDQGEGDLAKQAAAAYRLAYLRGPTRTELEMARAFFERQQALVAERIKAGEEVAVPPDLSESVGRARAAALVDFCHALINANEFVYVQ